jgi:hypothetical protein
MGQLTSLARVYRPALRRSTSTAVAPSRVDMVATSTSGWNSLSSPFTKPDTSTKVIKAIAGMYRSGAFSSSTGGAGRPLTPSSGPPLPAPEACASVMRSHFFFEKGKSKICEMRVWGIRAVTKSCAAVVYPATLCPAAKSSPLHAP